MWTTFSDFPISQSICHPVATPSILDCLPNISQTSSACPASFDALPHSLNPPYLSCTHSSHVYYSSRYLLTPIPSCLQLPAQVGPSQEVCPWTFHLKQHEVGPGGGGGAHLRSKYSGGRGKGIYLYSRLLALQSKFQDSQHYVEKIPCFRQDESEA